MAETKPPKVFISYAWEDELKTWVREFATRLRSDGINAILDQWETVPGDQLTQFMEKSVRESDFVVFICTPTYKRKSDRRRGGVGYEGSIITGEVFSKNNHRKFIPALRKGKWATASPSWASSKLFIDFRGEPYSEASYQHLLDTLFGKSPTAPPLRDDTLREQLEREAAEKAAREKSAREEERETAEKFAREKAEREAEEATAEKIKHEKEERAKAEKEAKEKARYEEIKKRRLPYYETSPLKKPAHEELTPEKPQTKKTKPLRKPNMAIVVALIGLVGTIIAALLGSPIIENWFSPVIAPTEQPTTTLTLTLEPVTPTHPVESTPTLTVTITPTSTRLSAEITDAEGIPMKLVSAGTFTMGFSADEALSFCQTISSHIGWYGLPCRKEDYLHEEPVHDVYLNNFFMDVYEVSNKDYEKCAMDNVCMLPSSKSANRYSNYYGNENFHEYPVLNVTWDMAKKYCEWRSTRLPTEAEWEKAARGIDRRSHPWGNFNGAYEVYNPDFYRDRANLNITGFNIPTMPVFSNSRGLSPYGIYNMAGNVAEWIADWYGETYYAESELENPLGPTSGQYKVIRGGSVNNIEVRTTARDYRKPSEFNAAIGFRCAKDANP